jgi:hypothetical protein
MKNTQTISPTAKRYMLAYHKLQSDMPKWKHEALLSDLSSSVDSTLVKQFLKDVTQLAENNNEIFLTN